MITKEYIKKNAVNKYPAEAKALAAVKQDGDALQYVRDQTEAICLAAVQQYGFALRYVHNQTEAICLAAVKQDGDALQYVHDQTEAICLAAVKQYGDALQYVDPAVFTEEDTCVGKVVEIEGKRYILTPAE